MRRFFSIALRVLVWVAAAAYIVFAVRYCRGRQRGERLERVEIRMMDTLGLIDAATVRGWLDSARLACEGMPLEALDTRAVLDTILSHPVVAGAGVWVEQSGAMYVEVGQRRPVLRLARGGGDDVYLSADMHFIPVHSVVAQYVPVVSGEIPYENFEFLAKLSNFVESVVEGSFWQGRIVQIVVREPRSPWGEPEVELVPREGRFRILLGELEDARQKMDKLELMYRNVLPWEGWDTYAVLDIANRGQVVARRSAPVCE